MTLCVRKFMKARESYLTSLLNFCEKKIIKINKNLLSVLYNAYNLTSVFITYK